MSIKNNTTSLQEILEVVNALPEAGTDLPDLTNEGDSSKLLEGYELIDSKGKKVTGNIPINGSINKTFDGINTKSISISAGYTTGGTVGLDNTIDDEVDVQADLISQLITTINELPEAKQATPEISVSSNGLITATAGTKSTTKQLAFQAAKTITPSTASQIAVSSGYYTGGDITVNPIPSSYIIPSGTLTITANGTHDVKSYASAVINIESSGGGGGGNETLSALIDGTITSYSDSSLTEVRSGLFMNCGSLSAINFPECTRIKTYAFSGCSKLTNVSFPKCTTVDDSAFLVCSKITNISFPACKTIGGNAFARCYSLAEVYLPACTNISMSGFASCEQLTTLNLPVCISLQNYAFNTCKILTDVSLPACQLLNNSAFSNCYALSTISLPAITTISASAFMKCFNLKSLYLMGSTVCALKHSNAFTSTPIGGYSASAGTYGSIYVPTSMLTSYQTATNWTYFSSRMVGI